MPITLQKRAYSFFDASRRPPLNSPRWSAQVMSSLQSAFWSNYFEPYKLIRALVGPVKWKSCIPLTWRRPNESRYGQFSKPTCTICAWTCVCSISGWVWLISSHTSYKLSSFGWDPDAKRKELFHSLSRFILVYEVDTDELLAFTMFRFEVEEGEILIYWQAIQTAFPI